METTIRETTHEAKARIVSTLALVGVQVPRTRIGGNVRWVHVAVDANQVVTAATALRAAGMAVTIHDDLPTDLYITR